MIEIDHVTKRYGDKLAVDDVSVQRAAGSHHRVPRPQRCGQVDHDADDRRAGRADCRDRARQRPSYRSFKAPLHEVGALLEARAIHTGRSAYHHLLAMAQTHGIGRARVDEVIDLVGLGSVARKRAGGFSLGMGQRLGIAAAMLADPQTLILDEPSNGLDPEGILWIRTLLKQLASEGRTVFLSSHLMSEMAVTAEHLVIVGRGRVIADTTVDEVVAQASADAAVRVRSPQATELREVLAGDASRSRAPSAACSRSAG